MGRQRSSSRGLLAAALAVVGVLAMAPAAIAAHHLVRISEVYPGSTLNPMSEFVELQLGAAGENQLNTTTVRLYNATGAQTGSATFTGNPANGENQRYVLAATAIAQTQFSIAADIALSNADALSPAGGAVCFTTPSPSFPPPTGPGIDCMSWGSFMNTAADPQFPTNTGAATGTPRAAIPDNFGTPRNDAPGCATLMQPTIDDTNNSVDDFASNGPPTPQNNASPVTNSECVLTVRLSGVGTVTGPGISCPGDCTQTFANGETVTLVASATQGSTFSGWAGCPTPSGTSCEASMAQPRTIDANFSPASPAFAGTTPSSPANDNNPEIRGTAQAGSTVQLFTNATCAGAPVATGSAATFASPGITVAVGDNTTTTFRARATNSNGTSACSTSSIGYTEATPPAVVPPPLATPSGAFALGELEGRTLQLTVASAGVGEVADAGARASGKPAAAAARRRLKTSSASGGPGTIEVTLRLTKAGKRKLREKGKVKVNARISFSPVGGSATSQTTKLVIKKK